MAACINIITDIVPFEQQHSIKITYNLTKQILQIEEYTGNEISTSKLKSEIRKVERHDTKRLS